MNRMFLLLGILTIFSHKTEIDMYVPLECISEEHPILLKDCKLDTEEPRCKQIVVTLKYKGCGTVIVNQ